MTRVNHPTLPVSREVPDADVPRWEASGWVRDTPAAPEPVSTGWALAPSRHDEATQTPAAGGQ